MFPCCLLWICDFNLSNKFFKFQICFEYIKNIVHVPFTLFHINALSALYGLNPTLLSHHPLFDLVGVFTKDFGVCKV
jgi:hypothetical protein